MNFFIAEALAQEPAGATSALGGFIPLIIIFILFYFLLIRPQTKRSKEHKAMVSALGKGDEVVTNGGVLGRINDVGDNFITLEVAKGVQIKVQRSAISSLVPKGTAKGTGKSE